jgi:hypothetical protein
MGGKVSILCRALTVSRQTWYDWESGTSKPDEQRWSHLEAVLGLPRGAIREALKPPYEGPTLDYWVGRWEQQTLHFRRLLADQEELLSLMRSRAERGGVPLPEPMDPDTAAAVAASDPMRTEGAGDPRGTRKQGNAG